MIRPRSKRTNPSHGGLSCLAFVGAALAASCSGSSTNSAGLDIGGSATESGGSATTGSSVASGGTTAAGGSGQTSGGTSLTNGSGGTSFAVTGGSRSAGGAATGGAATGGITATGGRSTGGTSTGGTPGTGGTQTSGGSVATGGLSANGGQSATGGRLATGGTQAVGGATGGTIATGGSKTTGGATSAGGSNCGYTPVTPNATQATRNVLCYLHEIYGKGILSGQEEDNNDNGMNTVYAATGKYPAIRAFDVNNSQAPTQCVTHWNNGGICMFGYHMGINGGTYNTATNINNVLIAGTAENTSFNADLDRVAQYVQPLKAAGGVAILRLFHEAGTNCKWFWWSMGTSAQWQSLFKYAFNYLTATKGLNNVLWMAPLCGSPSTAYNPGTQYIDMGGADTYVSAGDTQPLTNMFQQTQTAFPNMMVALHECGTIPDPAQLQSTGTKWLMFNVWANPYFNAPYNTAAHLKDVYSHPYVITRDKLPSFK